MGKDDKATWKQVKIDQAASKDTVLTVTVRFRLPRGYKDQNWYDQKFVFGADATLGDVFRRFVRIVNRTSTQHVACVH